MRNDFGDRFVGKLDNNGEKNWWHKGGIGVVEISAVEAWNKYMTPYWLEKRPMKVFLNGADNETGEFSIIRSAVPDDPEERVMGTCKKGYKILQPDEICTLFDENVKQTISTLGALDQGKKLFISWELPMFEVKGDTMQIYGAVLVGYNGLLGYNLHKTHIRPVCENTYNMVIQENNINNTQENATGRVWSGRHNSDKLGRDLGIWLAHVQEQALLSSNESAYALNKMAEKPVDDTATLADLLFNIYPDPKQLPKDYPIALRAEKQAIIDEKMESQEADRRLVENLFNGQGIAITADGYGLFNAVTEYENHWRKSKKDTLNSILFGNRAKQMQMAYNIISDWAK